VSDLLSAKEIERLTGIASSSPIRHRNMLNKQGIHCVINDQHQVVVWRSWVDAAALPKEFLSKYIAKLSANEDQDDIGMKLEALNG
jgi:hypothetical protein